MYQRWLILRTDSGGLVGKIPQVPISDWQAALEVGALQRTGARRLLGVPFPRRDRFSEYK